MTDEQRRHVDNLILLSPNHHKLIAVTQEGGQGLRRSTLLVKLSAAPQSTGVLARLARVTPSAEWEAVGMRRIIGAVTGVVAIAGLLALAPVPADAGNSLVIEVTKTVQGPGTSGPFSIEVTCLSGTVTPSSSFDLNDGESQTVFATAESTTCTVTETGTQGAAVSYSCTALTGPPCDDDQTLHGSGSGRVHITNTFDEPEPQPEPEA